MTTLGQRMPYVGTLLGVWAHPDDEAFLSAGLMAHARELGHRVVVATATRGEHGTDDPARWPPERLAVLREREMALSLAAVDVHEHRWLGHRDGALAGVSPSSAVAQVVDLMEEVRPDTVVTFGPDGMTGHDDHRTVSAWVTRAWHRTGCRSRLWYATLSPAFHRDWGSLNEEVGLWFPDTEPPETPDPDLVAHLRCEGAVGDRKHSALRAHASQVDGLVSRVGEERFRQWWAVEAFVAFPGPSPAGHQGEGARKVAAIASSASTTQPPERAAEPLEEA